MHFCYLTQQVTTKGLSDSLILDQQKVSLTHLKSLKQIAYSTVEQDKNCLITDFSLIFDTLDILIDDCVNMY